MREPPQGRLQWPVAISHLAWWLVSPPYHLGQEESQHGPQAELPLLTDAPTECRHSRPCLPCRPSVPHAMHTRNTRIHEKNPPGRSSGARERQADLSSSLQRFRPGCRGRRKRVERSGVGWGQGRVSEVSRREQRKGIQNGLTCLIFCALHSWKGGREKKKGKEKKEQRLKAHISLRSQSPIF